LDKESIISKLKESLEKNYGDEGRTLYIIEKLQKDLQLPKSDHLYSERMIKLCEPEIKGPEVISEIKSTSDLVKCNICDSSIKLDEKSIRKNGFWLHEKCFEKIPIIKTESSVIETEILQKTETVPKVIRQPIKIIKPKTTYAQMAFSGGLLASLVGSVYFLAGEMLSVQTGL